MKSQHSKFIACSRKLFSFLIDKYGFREIHSKTSSYGDEILYKNATTGVLVRWEFRDRYIYVALIKLIHGNVPPYPIFIRSKSNIDWFYLDDLLSIRRKNFEALQADFQNEDEKKLTVKLKKISVYLEREAEDVLKGDFSVFPKLDLIVKERAKRLRLGGN